MPKDVVRRRSAKANTTRSVLVVVQALLLGPCLFCISVIAQIEDESSSSSSSSSNSNDIKQALSLNSLSHETASEIRNMTLGELYHYHETLAILMSHVEQHINELSSEESADSTDATSSAAETALSGNALEKKSPVEIVVLRLSKLPLDQDAEARNNTGAIEAPTTLTTTLAFAAEHTTVVARADGSLQSVQKTIEHAIDASNSSSSSATLSFSSDDASELLPRPRGRGRSHSHRSRKSTLAATTSLSKPTTAVTFTSALPPVSSGPPPSPAESLAVTEASPLGITTAKVDHQAEKMNGTVGNVTVDDITTNIPLSSSTEDSSNSITSVPIIPLIPKRQPLNEPVSPNPLDRLTKGFNITQCVQLTQDQLVKELKDKGNFNPDFMAWDVRGVLHFLEKMAAKYEPDPKPRREGRDAIIERNVMALERLLKELNIQGCNVNSQDVLTRIYNFTRDLTDSSKSFGRLRTKRESEQNAEAEEEGLGQNATVPNIDEFMRRYKLRLKYLNDLYSGQLSRDDSSHLFSEMPASSKDPESIGSIHVVPFGCQKRGAEEDGYLRMCGSCQAIRRMPDSFFPPYINEVVCDEDKACLYFYDYPHGKCKQKNMNFVVLQNIGTPNCQIWKKFNLNIRVCCECFVDEKSFFAKYV